MKYRYLNIGFMLMFFFSACASNTVPENNASLECGNSEYSHIISIKDEVKSFTVVANVKLTYSDKMIQKDTLIVSVPKTQVDRIYFENGKQKYEDEVDEVSYLALYFQKENQHGLLGYIDTHYEKENFVYAFAKREVATKCGQYDIVNGVVDIHGVFRRIDGGVVNMLDGLDVKKYVGKRLLLSGRYWYQRGGLLKADGSDAGFSVDNLLEASVVQVVDSEFDDALIEKKCNALKGM